jgi:glycosyltransferase involved in cell wall biosynthesis
MRRVPAPVVVVAHSEGLKRRYRSLLFLLNRQAILHVAVSKRVAESVQCRGAHRVCVSYLGASTTQQEDVATPERQGLTFLFLGRLAPSKRVDLLLDVLRTIATDFRSAGARLLIVGTGSELPSLKSFVRRHRLDDIVSFKGTVRPVDEVLAVSDVFILCSDYEGMPVSIFEALLAGLQIIATDVGGISEVVHSEEGHHLVRPRDSSAIRGAMLQALHAGQQPARRLERKAAAAHLHALNAATSFYDLLAEALLHEHGATLRTWQKVSSDEQ